MGLTDWLFVPLFMLIAVSLGLLLVLGGTVVFPRRWESELRRAARDEVARRFKDFGLRSQDDLVAADRLIGTEQEHGAPSEEAADLVLSTVLVLTDRSDRENVDKELTALRARLQLSALRRQVQIVANVADIRIASYVWRACDWFNRCFFAFAGFVWFFPKSLPFLIKRLQKNSGALTVGGLIAGIAWAAFTRAVTPEGASFDWVGLVSGVALIFALGGIVVAVLGLYKAVLVSRFGAPREWTKRGVVTGIGMLALYMIMVALGASGVLAQWQRSAALWAQDLDVTEDAGRWVGGIMLAAFTVYFLRYCYRWVRMPGLNLSDRLWIVSGTPVMLLMLFLMALFTINVPATGLAWLFTSTAWIVLILGGAASVTASFEWIQKYRALRDIDRHVPRKGFRWWALVAWGAIAVVLAMLWPLLMTTGLRTSAPVLVVPLVSLLNIVASVWSLAFFPGAIITGLYVRRVAKAYDTVRFSLAPAHPLLGDSSPDASNVCADEDNDQSDPEDDDCPGVDNR